MTSKFNFGNVTTREPEIDEITKEELMARRRFEVKVKRIGSVVGKAVGAFAAGVVAYGAGIAECNKLMQGYDENNPAGALRTTAAVGSVLLGSIGMTAAWMGGAYLVESEIESWDDSDYDLEEAEVDDEEPERKAFDPDKRVDFDFLK